MPKDVYRWEEGGALVHHCPICQTPLTDGMCRRVCLGKHVEWCSRYHCQLFRKGWANQCAPCRHSEEQHDKRHREIAQLLHQLKELQNTQEPRSPIATALQDPATPSTLSKKERKAAKKTAKLAVLPKVITTVDIDRVARILHPGGSEKDQADEERRLLEDPDIKLNLYYHKGTSNTREVRYRHLEHMKEDQEVIDVADEELESVLAALKVPKNGASTAESQLIESIRKAVHYDLLNVAKEDAQIAFRKAGFWRWASKKVYNKLLENGRISEQKADETQTPKRKDSVLSPTRTGSAKLNAVSTQSAPSTPNENVPATPLTGKFRRSLLIDSPMAIQQRGGAAMDDGWTQVGKVKSSPKPGMTVKLSGNGGLAKLKVKPTTMYGALGHTGPGYQSGD